MVVTEVEPVGPFWEAEPEHQDYLERYPDGVHVPLPASRMGTAPSQCGPGEATQRVTGSGD